MFFREIYPQQEGKREWKMFEAMSESCTFTHPSVGGQKRKRGGIKFKLETIV